MKKTLCLFLFGMLCLPTFSQPLKVHPNKHFLTTTDDKPFFWMADTGWELFHRLDREECSNYLKTRKAQGFNIIQAVVLFELEALETPNAYGDFPLIGEDISQPALTKGNDPEADEEYDYWDHVKYIVEMAAMNDMIVGLLPCWGEYVTPRFRDRVISTIEEGYAYGHFIGDWLKDYNDHIIWILGGDRLPDEQPDGVEIWRAMAEGITDAVTGDAAKMNGQSEYAKTFMTFHCFATSSLWFSEDAWIDMHTWGSYHGEKNFERAFYQGWKDWKLENHLPFVNSEPAYENHPVNYDYLKAEKGFFTDVDVRQIAYWSVFAGAAGHTYGANGVWQMYKKQNTKLPETPFKLEEWSEAVMLPGAQQLIHLKELMLSLDYYNRKPDQDILAQNLHDPPGRLVACSGNNYSLVYTPTGKEVWIDSGKLGFKEFDSQWYNPREGTYSKAVYRQNEKLLIFDAPGETQRGNDWVLILNAKQ